MDLPPFPEGRRWLDLLQQLFCAIDAAYLQVSERAGFQCNGCGDNCCETLFHHHTLLEYHYLGQALAALGPEERRRVAMLAEEACRRYAAAEKEGRIPRVMCPLNLGGRCIVYDHRPMICRMHGVAHRLRRPDGKIIRGPGCAEFSRCDGGRQGGSLDRTPFYSEMASLEGELRRAISFQGRIRMTVAEMVKRICAAGSSQKAAVEEGGRHADP